MSNGETDEMPKILVREPQKQNEKPQEDTYTSEGLLIKNLEVGELSKKSEKLVGIASDLQEEIQKLLKNPPPEELVDKYPEIQSRIYTLNRYIHRLGEKSGYTSPPWDKAWNHDGTPEAKIFWEAYLRRPFDKIEQEGFWACSDPATVYVALARKLSLDAHYVSCVQTDWINSDQIEDPNQHAFVEIRTADTRILCEPFDILPRAAVTRTPEGFTLITSTKGKRNGWEESSLISTNPEEDFDEVVDRSYNNLGYTKWRENGDPKGIGVSGLQNMIENVREDFAKM